MVVLDSERAVKLQRAVLLVVLLLFSTETEWKSYRVLLLFSAETEWKAIEEVCSRSSGP